MKKSMFAVIRRRIDLVVPALVLLVLLVLVTAYYAGARINRTNSLPKGLYWLVDKEPERGDIVSFCPDGSAPFRPDRHRHYIILVQYNILGDVGYDAVMKKLMGLPGDVISITGYGVTVNGEPIANSQPYDRDNVGDPLPVIRLHNYTLQENEVLFMSDHLPRSFDARYFGIQAKRQILDVLVPVVTWRKKSKRQPPYL